MSDSAALILGVIILVIAIWMFRPRPDAGKAQAEQGARAAEARARAAVDRAQLTVERDALLTRIRTEAPGFILRAKLDFERAYRAGTASENFFGHEMSPLVCFGYRVGVTNGRPGHERHAILDYAIAADLDAALPFLPADYRREWGAPLSPTRFNRIHQHLTKMADLRDGRQNLGAAVADWRADADWFHARQISVVQRFRTLQSR